MTQCRLISAWSAFFLMLSVFSPPLALAHRIVAFASWQGDHITVEGYFPGGDVVKNAKVEVLGPDGKVVAQGHTDGKGVFSFKPKASPPYTIILDAGSGHMAKTTLGADPSTELSQGDREARDTREEQPGNDDMGDEKLDQVLRQLNGLQSEIHSLRVELSEIRLRDVIGGIGYLLGIFGIFAILKTRGCKEK